MYKKMRTITKELFLVSMPGINRLLPVIALPIIVKNEEATAVIGYLSFSSVVVLVTAIGFINVILAAPKAVRPKRLVSIIKINSIFFVLASGVVFLNNIFFRGDIEEILIPLWVYLWGVYQLYRSYLIFENKKEFLIVYESISLIVLVTALFLFNFHGLYIIIPFISLVPFLIFFYIDLKNTNGSQITIDFLKSSLYFSLANLFSASAFMLFPFFLKLTNEAGFKVIVAGVCINVLSVSMLVNRSLSNYFIPRLLDSNKSEFNNEYYKFVRLNKLATIIVYLVTAICLDYYLSYFFSKEYDGISGNKIVYILTFVMATTQLLLPASNLLTIKNQSKKTAAINAGGLIIFIGCVSIGYFFTSLQSMLLYLISLIIGNFFRIILSYFVEKGLIDESAN